MLHAEGGDKLLVHWFVTVLAENAEESLSFVKRLCGLTKPTGQTVSYQGLFQYLLGLNKKKSAIVDKIQIIEFRRGVFR